MLAKRLGRRLTLTKVEVLRLPLVDRVHQQYTVISLTEKSRVLAVQVWGYFLASTTVRELPPYLDNRLSVLVLVSLVQAVYLRLQVQTMHSYQHGPVADILVRSQVLQEILLLYTKQDSEIYSPSLADSNALQMRSLDQVDLNCLVQKKRSILSVTLTTVLFHSPRLTMVT